MITTLPQEAYKWWNQIANPFIRPENTPFRPKPVEATQIWLSFFPIFQLLSRDDLSPELYWPQITKIVSIFCNSDDIPNPLTCFPEFVASLYKLRHSIRPNNSAYCIELFNKFRYHNFGENFLFKIPIFIFDPMLYFQSILFISDTKSPIWDEIITTNSISDAFFNFYQSFLCPLLEINDHENWDYVLTLSEILFRLISQTIKTNPNSLKNSNKYCDNLLKILPTAPMYASMTLTRSILTLTKLTQLKNEKSETKARIKQLLSIFSEHRNTEIFVYLVKFVKTNLSKSISNAKLLNSISINSLANIDLLLPFSKNMPPIAIVTRLAKAIISSKIWHRASFAAMVEIFNEYNSNNDLKEWLTVYVRRMLIFALLSNIHHKYSNRALLIVESISTLASLNSQWLRQIILNTAYTLGTTNNAPPYFLGFFFPFSRNSSNIITYTKSPCSISEVALLEFDSYLKMPNISFLKTFPFDGNKTTFILPPQSETKSNENGMKTNLPKKKLSDIRVKPTSAIRPKIGQKQQKSGKKKKISPIIKKPKTPALHKFPHLNS